MKRCTGCGEEKDEAEFYPRKRRSGSYALSPSCKACHVASVTEAANRRRKADPDGARDRQRVRTAAWRDANPGATRRYHLKKLGLTPEKYDELLERQGGGCAVCGRTDSGDGRPGWVAFHVDHDRRCCPVDRACERCVRGLLCTKCNRGLGHFDDDPELLALARAYLLEHAAK